MPTPEEMSQSLTIAATHSDAELSQNTTTLVNGGGSGSSNPSTVNTTTATTTAIDQAQPSSTDNSSSSLNHKAPTDKCRRAEFVHHLVDCATQVIESIWPAPPPTAVAVKLLPLRLFVQEVLRRSRTSYVTLQTALFYLTRVHNSPWAHHMTEENCSFLLDSAADVSGTTTTAHCLIDALSAAAFAANTTIPATATATSAAITTTTTTTATAEDSNEGMATPPDSQRGSSPALTSAELEFTGRFPTTSATHAIEARLATVAAAATTATTTNTTSATSTIAGSSTTMDSSSPLSSTMSSSDPRQCGRRMFLASLVIATKYLQDRAYSNRAWSRVSGLSASEITRCERKLLNWLGWNLYIPDKEFSDFQADLLARVNAAGHTNTAAPMTSAVAQATATTTPTTNVKSTLAPTRAYSATIPVSKDILLKAFAAGRSVSLPVNKASPTPPSPCTPGIVIGRPQHGFASPTPSPHPCASETTTKPTIIGNSGDDRIDRMQRKRPRPDNEMCEQMLRDILAQRPRTAAVAATSINTTTTTTTTRSTIGW